MTPPPFRRLWGRETPLGMAPFARLRQQHGSGRRWLWRVALLVALLAATSFAAVTEAMARPERVLRVIEARSALAPGSLAVRSIEWVGGRRMVVHGLRFRPDHPARPHILVTELRASMPWPWAFWRGRLDLGTVELRGLSVHLEQQRPSPRVTPPADPLTVCASSVDLSQGRVSAVEDPPLGAVLTTGVSAQLQHTCWVPATRAWTTTGAIQAPHVDIGAIGITDVVLPDLVATGLDIRAHGSTASFGTAQVSVDADLVGLDRRPDLRLSIETRGASVADMISTATGRQGPVSGTAWARLQLDAGGDLPRGGAIWSGTLGLERGAILLGDGMGAMKRLALDAAPWVELEDGALLLGDARVAARFGRGWVEIDRAAVDPDHGEGRDLVARGRITRTDSRITVESSSRALALDRVGVVVEGLPPHMDVQLLTPATPR